MTEGSGLMRSGAVGKVTIFVFVRPSQPSQVRSCFGLELTFDLCAQLPCDWLLSSGSFTDFVLELQSRPEHQRRIIGPALVGGYYLNLL